MPDISWKFCRGKKRYQTFLEKKDALLDAHLAFRAQTRWKYSAGAVFLPVVWNLRSSTRSAEHLPRLVHNLIDHDSSHIHQYFCHLCRHANMIKPILLCKNRPSSRVFCQTSCVLAAWTCYELQKQQLSTLHLERTLLLFWSLKIKASPGTAIWCDFDLKFHRLFFSEETPFQVIQKQLALWSLHRSGDLDVRGWQALSDL